MARQRAERKRTWLVTTITEPFPVFFSHVSYPSERRRETAKGPFYAAGSKTYELPEDRAHAESRAEFLRERGWTVTIAEEVR